MSPDDKKAMIKWCEDLEKDKISHPVKREKDKLKLTLR